MDRNQAAPLCSRRIRIVVTAIAMGLPAVHAAGDDAGDENNEELAPITISGDKLGREVSESSDSVGVVTEEDIQSSSARNMQETVSRFGNVLRVFNDRELAIRGIPQNGINGDGETISVYLDGVPLTDRAADFAGPLSTFDLERVEVFRGPQSTARGRNSLAGAVFMQSHEATPEWDAHARMADVSHDGHQYAFAGGGPLIDDQLMFRVSANDRYNAGDITNVTRGEDDAGREDVETRRAKLTLAPDALSGYRATLSVTQGETEFGDNRHDVTFGERTESANVRYNETYEGEVYSLKQTMLLGRHYDLTAITGWIDGDGTRKADFDRTEEEGGFSTFDLLEERLTQELRLNFNYDRLRGVFGLYYEDTENRLRNEGEGIEAGGGFATVSGFATTRNNVETTAAFTEIDWTFIPDWRLTLGLRWNREDSERRANSDFTTTLQVPADQLPPPLDSVLAGLGPGVPIPDSVEPALAPAGVPQDYDVRENQDFSVLLPKVGLTWMFLDPHSVSLTYQEGYRSGGTSVTLFGGEPSVFDPEYTKTLELALRTRWLDRSLEANVNVFYTDWEDQQVLIGDASGFDTRTTNAGSSHLYGGEAELLWRFARHFESFASLGLLETEFDEFVNEGQDFGGNEFPYAPDYTATLGLAMLPWRGFEGQISVQRVGDYYSGPSNTEDRFVPARTLVNARVAYEFLPSLSVFAFGRNLNDDENIQGQLPQGNGDRIARRYGESRTLGIGLEWQP